MSATSETLAIFVGVDTLALPWLIAKGKLVTPPLPRRRGTQTTARAAAEVAPAALAAQSPAQLTSVKPETDKRRNPRLPKLPDAAEMKNPRLAEYARGRQRDPVTGHFVPTKQAS